MGPISKWVLRRVVASALPLETESLETYRRLRERAGSGVCYLERLCVLPGFRRRGFGEELVSRVLAEAVALGARQVDIGIIEKHTELREWYRKLGFTEGESKDFPHLPFRVLFMSKELA